MNGRSEIQWTKKGHTRGIDDEEEVREVSVKRGEKRERKCRTRNEEALTIQKRVDPTKMCPLCSLHLPKGVGAHIALPPLISAIWTIP